MSDDETESSDDGIEWEGTREELRRWIEYKRGKVTSFVRDGWSVGWYPDASNWMYVFTPPRPHSERPGYLASVMFFGKPSPYGIDGGAVSKLRIQRSSASLESFLYGPHTEIVYNYDRGHDVNRLEQHPEGRRLYDAVIRGLNYPD